MTIGRFELWLFVTNRWFVKKAESRLSPPLGNTDGYVSASSYQRWQSFGSVTHFCFLKNRKSSDESVVSVFWKGISRGCAPRTPEGAASLPCLTQALYQRNEINGLLWHMHLQLLIIDCSERQFTCQYVMFYLAFAIPCLRHAGSAGCTETCV